VAIVWVAVSGVQDPDFGVQSGRIFGFFGFGLDWISFSFQPDPDNPNEIKSGPAKILIWNNSCIRKNYDISKSYTKIYLSDVSR